MSAREELTNLQRRYTAAIANAKAQQQDPAQVSASLVSVAEVLDIVARVFDDLADIIADAAVPAPLASHWHNPANAPDDAADLSDSVPQYLEGPEG